MSITKIQTISHLSVKPYCLSFSLCLSFECLCLSR